MVNRETFRIEIDDHTIWYGDRKWNRLIRLIPKDEDFIKKVRESRNKIPIIIAEMFRLTEAEQKEFEGAKTDEELAEICIKDAKSRGARLLKKDG